MDLSTNKTSITQLPVEEQLSIHMEIRKKRLDFTTKQNPKKKAASRERANLKKIKQSPEQLAELLKLMGVDPK